MSSLVCEAEFSQNHFYFMRSGFMSFRWANLSHRPDNLGGWNQLDLFFQLGHHLTQNIIGHCMRMADSHRLPVTLGDANQLFNLSADDIRAKENMNALPDGAGKKYLMPLNMEDVQNPRPRKGEKIRDGK